MKYLLAFIFFTLNLNAMNCSDYKDFQLFNGHYYSVSINKLTFENAKQIAINNGGTLAIPNSQAENNFIKNLIGGGSIGWIGIYDPNKIQNFCFDSANCLYDSTRFRTVLNQSLLYKNFHPQQPDNAVKQYDVVEGKSMVSPLGEHWVAMDGNNGQWFDTGNHADEHNNPVKYKAVFEFENLNECTPPTDDVKDFTEKVCNTKIWDSKVDTLVMGQTFECQKDTHNNYYCPEALADAAQEWDYENGYSVSGVGSTVDYTSKVESVSYTAASFALQESYDTCTKWRSDDQSSWCETIHTIPWTNVATFSIPQLRDGFNGARFSQYPSYKNYRISGGQLQESYDTCTKWRSDDQSLWCETIHTIPWTNVATFSIPQLRDGFNGARFLQYPSNYRISGSCSNGTTPINGQCKITTIACPSGYTETTGTETSKGQCKKTITYTYYNYLCNSSANTQGYNYLPNNKGGDSSKTDPNKATQNPELSSPTNSSTPPTNNCKREKFLCKFNEERPAVFVDGKWQCSPFPCIGNDDIENLDTNVGSSDKNNNGWSEDGNCNGTIYIFNGKSNKCRSWDMFFGLTGGGCCDKDKVAAGLVACKENEKLLAKKREKKHTHYVGNFCSKKIRLGFIKICIQKSDGYCTFNSSLAKIIQVQGREQLGISWGSPENPQCRGFTPEEFQKIDFSKIDLTEFVKDIQSSIQTSVIQNLGTYVKDKVENFYGN